MKNTDELDRSIEGITNKILAFRDARDWQQFHSPKEMAVALIAEAGELLQHFVWKDTTASWQRAEEKRAEVTDEIADVGILLFELAAMLKLDLGEAILAKLERNELRYPVHLSKGNNLKYNELGDG